MPGASASTLRRCDPSVSGAGRRAYANNAAYVASKHGLAGLAWATFLDALDPLAKQVMVEAITAAVSHDGRVSVAESELLRTICGVLHCPLPPMLERH